MSEPTPGALPPGQIFQGRYEIVRCLKAGGMGAVYECIHRQTRKRRALKVMLPQILAGAGMRDRFEFEARVTAEIESEHIVETFDAGIDDATGAPFLVMELLRGEDLGSVLQRRGPLPAGETVLLLSQAAMALDKTHAAGIVHRDLKPDNLYVTARDDGSPRLKILDFGIAKMVAGGDQPAKQTAMIGTPLYMSQEQVLGEGTIGPRADVYAMGHIAFTLLTGRAYWDDEQHTSPALFAFLQQVMAGTPEPATARAARRGVALPPAFDAWFARATARSASDRFDRASTLVHELAEVLGVFAPTRPAVSVAPVGPPAPGPPPGSMLAVPGSGSIGAPAQTAGGGATVRGSTKSIGALPGRSGLPAALIVLAMLGVAGVGSRMSWMFRGHPTPSPAAETAARNAMPASTPVAAAPTRDPDPPPTEPPTVMPVEAAPTAVPSVSTAPGPPAKPTPTAQPKPAAAAGRAAPAKGCDPPYEVDGAGHRRMKLQCL